MLSCCCTAGELNFNLVGVMLQGGSLLTESTRLVLIQILLQARGIKLNPIHTLFYIAPACFAFLRECRITQLIDVVHR